MNNRKAPLALALMAGMLSLAGCGDDKRPATFAVSGKVMYRKTTIPVGAVVVFHPIDPAVEKKIGGKPRGTVGEDGTYKLTMFGPDDGAPEGEYGVTVDWRVKPKEVKMVLSEEGGGGARPILNPKYSTPAQPFTKVTVKTGEKNEFNFEVD